MNHVFLSNQNIRMLWDVLIEEPIIHNLPQNKQELVYNNLIKNINLFYKNESENEIGDSLNLVSLNKKFLKIMLDSIRNEPVKKYKIEDIQTERQKMFEVQLNKRKNDFEQSITLKKPPVPNFTENIENDKIQNIEELIAQARMQRNFDVPDVPKEIKYIQIQEQVPNNFNKEIIELTTASNNKLNTLNTLNTVNTVNTLNNVNELNFLHKLKTIKEHDADEVNIKDRLDELEEKINAIYSMMEKIYNKINTEST